jgi:hypothetical protein
MHLHRYMLCWWCGVNQLWYASYGVSGVLGSVVALASDTLSAAGLSAPLTAWSIAGGTSGMRWHHCKVWVACVFCPQPLSLFAGDGSSMLFASTASAEYAVWSTNSSTAHLTLLQPATALTPSAGVSALAATAFNATCALLVQVYSTPTCALALQPYLYPTPQAGSGSGSGAQSVGSAQCLFHTASAQLTASILSVSIALSPDPSSAGAEVWCGLVAYATNNAQVFGSWLSVSAGSGGEVSVQFTAPAFVAVGADPSVSLALRATGSHHKRKAAAEEEAEPEAAAAGGLEVVGVLVTGAAYCWNNEIDNKRATPALCDSTPTSLPHVLGYSFGTAKQWTAQLTAQQPASPCSPWLLHGNSLLRCSLLCPSLPPYVGTTVCCAHYLCCIALCDDGFRCGMCGGALCFCFGVPKAPMIGAPLPLWHCSKPTRAEPLRAWASRRCTPASQAASRIPMTAVRHCRSTALCWTDGRCRIRNSRTRALLHATSDFFLLNSASSK